MIFPRPNKVFRSIYPDALWRVDTSKKEIYLTFDDGPTPGVTRKVLELLHDFNAKATFFCLGAKVKSETAIFDFIKNAGHSIGNHSYSHLKGRKTKNCKYFEDIDQFNKIFQSTLFRPPYGSLKFSQYNHLRQQFKLVFWDVMAYDFFLKIDHVKCFQIIKKYTRPGSIIVFHDSEKASKTMLPALKETLEYFSERGYEFEKL